MAKTKSNLIEISPDEITSNPENPRLIFREDDMRVLRESIYNVGIKVPLTVYADRKKYRILDGERRWRCARKLNFKKIPVIVQPKPDRLENLLTMFNIHNVRVDWDMIATAMKLGEIKKLLEKEEKVASNNELANMTGIHVSMVRNCLEILELPKKYINLLLKEAEKPKNQQKITPDLFIEINKSKRVIEKHMPEAFENIPSKQYMNNMVKKYQEGNAKSVTSFRNISKIARADNIELSRKIAVPILMDLIEDPTYSIEEAYDDSVKDAYEQREIASRADSLVKKLGEVKSKKQLSPNARESLSILLARIKVLLGQ